MRRIIAPALVLAALLTGGNLFAASADTSPTISQDIRTVRALDGIPPCKYEDGSGQRGACVWLDSRDGKIEGNHVLNVPNGKDKRAILFPSR